MEAGRQRLSCSRDRHDMVHSPKPPDEPDAGVLLVDLARAVDAAADGRVLVFGSAPPHGRDLDLLARGLQEAAIAARLATDGLHNRGVQWVAFRGCTAAGVELISAADWQLPPPELNSLFEEAEVLRGYRNLVVPAPHHALLIAARRVARAGHYSDRLRARVAARLDGAPSAWEEAAQRAPAWRAVEALASLRAMHADGSQPGRVAKMRSVGARLRALPESRQRAVAGAVRRLAGRPRIVAFSGLDGAGKSFQATSLQAALDQLAYSAVVIWPPASNVLFQADPALKRRLFAVLRALGRSDGREQMAVSVSPSGETSPEPLPRQRAALAHALAFVVAVVQAWAFRRGTRRAARPADVVIYDRYALDSIVYLRHRWGHGRAFPIQSALIRWLTKRPDRAFLLDVPPEVAYARKQDFPIDNLRERAVLYRQLHGQLGCLRLDGERPPEDLCAEIALSVWECLAEG
jgi:thymidylate kinase